MEENVTNVKPPMGPYSSAEFRAQNAKLRLEKLHAANSWLGSGLRKYGRFTENQESPEFFEKQLNAVKKFSRRVMPNQHVFQKVLGIKGKESTEDFDTFMQGIHYHVQKFKYTDVVLKSVMDELPFIATQDDFDESEKYQHLKESLAQIEVCGLDEKRDLTQIERSQIETLVQGSGDELVADFLEDLQIILETVLNQALAESENCSKSRREVLEFQSTLRQYYKGFVNYIAIIQQELIPLEESE